MDFAKGISSLMRSNRNNPAVMAGLFARSWPLAAPDSGLFGHVERPLSAQKLPLVGIRLNCRLMTQCGRKLA